MIVKLRNLRVIYGNFATASITRCVIQLGSEAAMYRRRSGRNTVLLHPLRTVVTHLKRCLNCSFCIMVFVCVYDEINSISNDWFRRLQLVFSGQKVSKFFRRRVQNCSSGAGGKKTCGYPTNTGSGAVSVTSLERSRLLSAELFDHEKKDGYQRQCRDFVQ